MLMKHLMSALKTEFIKNRRAKIVWVTFSAFGIAPLMGGVFMVILQDPETMEKAGVLSTKAQLMNFSADWSSYLRLLTQAVALGGVLIFGFVASWVFGREYAEGTAKDLLALPTSRATILNAKFIVYAIWCIALAISNLLISILIGVFLQLPPPSFDLIFDHLPVYALTTGLTLLLGTPVALMAVWGKGYLTPLGFVALVLVFSQVIAATGYGYYFPWAVPGLYSGAGGEFKEQLDVLSYTILILTSLAGYGATIFYWQYADQMN